MQSLKKIHAWAQMKVPLSNFLASGGDWFESLFVGNPEDRFYRVKAHMTNCACLHDSFINQFMRGSRQFCERGSNFDNVFF